MENSRDLITSLWLELSVENSGKKCTSSMRYILEDTLNLIRVSAGIYLIEDWLEINSLSLASEHLLGTS